MTKQVFIKSSFKLLVDNFHIPTLFSLDEVAYAYGKLGLIKFIIFFIVCFLKSDEYNNLMKSSIIVKQNDLMKASAIIKVKELSVQKRKDRKKNKKNNKNVRKVIVKNMEIKNKLVFDSIPKIPETRKKRVNMARLLVKKSNILKSAKLRHKKCPSSIRRKIARAEKFGNILDGFIRKGYGICFNVCSNFYICNSVLDDRPIYNSPEFCGKDFYALFENMKNPTSLVSSLWKWTDRGRLQRNYEFHCILKDPILDFRDEVMSVEKI
jgi:hypothetical protein